MNFQGMGCNRFCGRVSPKGALWEIWGADPLQGTVRGSGRRVLKMEHLSLWELCYGKQKV